MMPKLTFKNIMNHWKTIRTHRKWVRYYAFLAGIPIRGLAHDLSKYNPIEFFESARFWVQGSSPINEAKRINGISYAWMHHKSHNKHHYEYWMDNFDDGGIARLMPEKPFVELVCDYLAAGRAYRGYNFSYASERDWWVNKRNKCAMNIHNKTMLDIIFSDLAMAECNTGCLSPEELIKTGYIQEVWKANAYVDKD